MVDGMKINNNSTHVQSCFCTYDVQTWLQFSCETNWRLDSPK